MSDGSASSGRSAGVGRPDFFWGSVRTEVYFRLGAVRRVLQMSDCED